MANAKELYPDTLDRNYFWPPSDYGPILDSFGHVAIQVDDEDYQGDSRVLYNDEGRIGYLSFGWGSCSGCDALQGCESLAEVDELIKELHDQIQWFDSPAAALHWFTNHDWTGDYSWHNEEQRLFIEKSVAYLNALIATTPSPFPSGLGLAASAVT